MGLQNTSPLSEFLKGKHQIPLVTSEATKDKFRAVADAIVEVTHKWERQSIKIHLVHEGVVHKLMQISKALGIFQLLEPGTQLLFTVSAAPDNSPSVEESIGTIRHQLENALQGKGVNS